jgi:acetyl-CoA carboxylase/biotin carboxylase 1
MQGESYQLFGQEEPLGLRIRINGKTVMIPTVYNPSELRSDVTGKSLNKLDVVHVVVICMNIIHHI